MEEVYKTKVYVSMEVTRGAASIYGAHQFAELLRMGAKYYNLTAQVSAHISDIEDVTMVFLTKKKEK